MKKIICLFISLLFIMSGCHIDKATEKQMKLYEDYKDSLLANKEIVSKYIPFDYDIEIKEDHGKYKYTVSIYKPIVAMTHIKMLILNPDDLSTDYISGSAGIFSDTPVNLIPNQSNPANNFVKKIELQGVSKTKDFKIYALVTWKDDNELMQYQSYFSFNIIDGQNMKVVRADD